MTDIFALGRQALAKMSMIESYLLLLCALDQTTSLEEAEVKEGNRLVLDVLSKAQIKNASDVIVVAIVSILERKEVNQDVIQTVKMILTEMNSLKGYNGSVMSPRATVEVSALLEQYFK